MLYLMTGSLQSLPVLMTSQISIPPLGPRCIETVSKYQFIRDEDDTQVDPEDFMTSEAISTRHNQVSKTMDMVMPQTPLPVSHPPLPPPTSSLPPSLSPSNVPFSSTSPCSPPIAACSPSIDASPPVHHQGEKPHLAQPQQQREPSTTEDIQSPQPSQQRELSSPTL